MAEGVAEGQVVLQVEHTTNRCAAAFIMTVDSDIMTAPLQPSTLHSFGPDALPDQDFTSFLLTLDPLEESSLPEASFLSEYDSLRAPSLGQDDIAKLTPAAGSNGNSAPSVKRAAPSERTKQLNRLQQKRHRDRKKVCK